MSQLSQRKNGESGQLREFLKDLIQKKPTLVTSLELTDSIIINAVLIVQGTWNFTTRNIVLDGTSRTVYHGATQSIIAGKLEDTIILEVQSKRENLEPSDQDRRYLFGTILNHQLTVRTTEKSLFGLTEKVHRLRAVGVTFNADQDAVYLFLELKTKDIE